jgi:hypothetical protein
MNSKNTLISTDVKLNQYKLDKEKNEIELKRQQTPIFAYISIVATLVFLILTIVFLKYISTLEYDKTADANLIIDPQLEHRNRINCDQIPTYCFEDSNCSGICTIATTTRCSNGICINAAVINTTAPKNECDAAKGVITYFVGNPTLGRFDYLCKSIDLGIAPDDIDLPNRMCEHGNIIINYLQQFPDVSQCTCTNGYTRVMLANTSQIRNYADCLPNEKIHLII